MRYENEYGFEDSITATIRSKARQIVGKAGIQVNEVPDIEQEFATALHMAFPSYNPSKSKRITFASRIVDRQISKIIRHRKQEKRDYRRQSLSQDSHLSSRHEPSSDYLETFEHEVATRADEENADLRIDVAAAVARLPDDLKEIVRRLRTENVAEAARNMGVPRTTLYGAIERIRLFFQGAGLKAYL